MKVLVDGLVEVVVGIYELECDLCGSHWYVVLEDGRELSDEEVEVRSLDGEYVSYGDDVWQELIVVREY